MPSHETKDTGGKENDNPNRFGPQCFLLDFYKHFKRKNEKQGYANFVKMNESPNMVINSLLNKESCFPINTLTPGQQSMLVPKFRLYKIYKNGSCKEFHFDDYTSVDTITTNNLSTNRARAQGLYLDPRGRPVSAGFKSFAWEDLGSNPANTGISFKADLKLTFANMDSVFRKQENGLSFSELIVPQGRKKGKKNPEYDEQEHRVKADVGWMMPSSFQNESTLWGTPKEMKSIQKALKASSISLFLNLTKHEISISENGTIEISFDFMASLEAGLLSPSSDIFYLGRKHTDRMKRLKQSMKNEQTNLEGLKKKRDELIATGTHQDTLFGVTYNDHPVIDAIDDQVTASEKNLEAYKKTIADSQEENLLTKYGNLLKKITQSNRFYSFDLTPADKEVYQKLNKLYQDKNLKPEELAHQRKEIIKESSLMTGMNQPYNNKPPSRFMLSEELTKTTEAPKEKTWMGIEKLGFLSFNTNDREEAGEALAEGLEKAVAKAKLVEDDRINYIFLGDLIQAAFETVAQNQKENGDKLKWRFLVGTISMWDANDEKFVDVNIADFPISWEYFQSFYLKKVIKPMIPKYNVRSFVSDIISQLLINSLSPTCFGKMKAQIKTRINSQVLTLPLHGSASEDDPIPKGGALIMDASTLKHKIKWEDQRPCNPNANKPDNRHYWFVYGFGFSSANLKGVLKDDAGKGIVHLPIGADRGLLKSISFKRQDMPGQAEANIAKAAEGGVTSNLMFSNKYNADLTLFGNTLFKPGMMIFLNTQGLGIGSPAQRGSAARRMGIGGYYRVTKVSNVIESGKFETTVTTVLESLGDDPKEAVEHISKTTSSGLQEKNFTNEKPINAVPSKT